MESWAFLSIYATLHLVHIVTGAVMGEVRSRSTPIVLTHSPLDPVGVLTSMPMIPTHPRIPRTAPDPPGEPAEGGKRRNLHLSSGELLTESPAEDGKGASGGKKSPTEPKLFLRRSSHGSQTPAKGDEEDEDGEDDAHENTQERLTHSLETIETHIPTRVPSIYLPQASQPTIRPTEDIQYTPRAEVSPITPGTLSTPAISMVTPLTPWIAGTPKTYWSESSLVTPWPPATPVTQQGLHLTINTVRPVTSAAGSLHLTSVSRPRSSYIALPTKPATEKIQQITLTTTHSVPSRGKLSLPNPHVHIKPTTPSATVILKETSNAKIKDNSSRIEEVNSRHSSPPRDLTYYRRKPGGSPDQRPLEDISKDINRQVARIWGGGDNEQLSALEEELYKDTASWPWLTGRRMRRKLSSDSKSISIVERSLPVQSTKATRMDVKATGEDITKIVDSLDDSKSRELKLSKSPISPNSSVSGVKYDSNVKSSPEKIQAENGAKSPGDFKITKTGDYGGFSVTKTEEVKPGRSDTISHSTSENKSVEHNQRQSSASYTVSKKTLQHERNVTVIAENPNTTNISKVDLSNKTRSDSQPGATVDDHSNEGKDATNSQNQNKSLNIESRSVTLPPHKPRTKYLHNVNDKRTKEQEEYDPSKRHSSPFIINSKQLREYKANADSHRLHKIHKSNSERHTHIAPTKVYPAIFSKTIKVSMNNKTSEAHKTTTLSSVFKEDLIPPLPYQWDKGWHAQKPEINPGSSNNRPAYGRERETVLSSFQTSTKLFKDGNKSPGNFKESHPSLVKSKPGSKQVHVKSSNANNVKHSATQPTNSLDNDLKDALVTLPGTDNPDLVTHLEKMEIREAIGRDPSWPGPGERVEFVTVVPGGQWDVWGGPSLFDPLSPHNSSYRSPQVYSVYWGDTGGPGSPAGWPEGVWVIRGGSLTAIMALVVTISVQVARDGPAHRGTATADSMHRAQHNQHATLATNLATSLASAHVLLIFGIQATGKAWVCGVVGLLLHFLHLVSCCWLLALTVRLLVALHHRRPIHTAVYCTASWGASLGLVVVSYVVNPEGYETRRYCWMSVERGMLVSFIVPVCTLILVNAGVCVAAQKVLLDKRDGVKHDLMTQHKRDLRGAVSLLPLEGISWFLAVVALEDHQSLALDCAAALVSASLGWLVLYFHGWTWKCHGLCWLRRQIASTSRRVDDLSLPLTARYDHDLAHQPLIPTQQTPSQASQPHTTVTLAPPTTPSQQQPPQQEEFPLQPIFPSHERREAY